MYSPVQVTFREPHWVGGGPTDTLNGDAKEKYKARYKNDGIGEGRILKRWTTAWQELDGSPPRKRPTMGIKRFLGRAPVCQEIPGQPSRVGMSILPS